MTITRRPARRAVSLRLRLDTEHRFGPPATYALTRRELATHIRHCRRDGWQRWELLARFGRTR